ncbi:MAG: tyrosine-type recombinase/integrase [Thaumarchaeota archaeon]|nr:tyrosine-type recombinase/integrase [Nitrososphaerota archaeon]
MFIKPKKINLDIFNHLNVSQSTIKHYQELTSYFLKFIEENNYRFQQPLLLKYKEYLKSAQLKPNTRRSYFNVARLFCQLLYASKLTKTDLTKDRLGRNIAGFQISKDHVYGIDQSGVNAIIQYINQLPPSFINHRLKIIVFLLLYQGLRQVEIFRLNVEDIDFDNNQLRITGKGRDYNEIINLHPKTAKALKQYCKYLNHKGALIVHCHNKTNRLASPLAIHYIVKSVLKKLDIQSSVHGFRHYFATQLIEYYRGDLTIVSMYTRHKNINTLQIYNDKILSQKDLKNYYAAVNRF